MRYEMSVGDMEINTFQRGATCVSVDDNNLAKI